MTDTIPADVRHFWMTVALGLKDELVVCGNRIAALEQERDELRARLAAVEAERVRLQVQVWGLLFEDGDMSSPELDGIALLNQTGCHQ